MACLSRLSSLSYSAVVFGLRVIRATSVRIVIGGVPFSRKDVGFRFGLGVDLAGAEVEVRGFGGFWGLSGLDGDLASNGDLQPGGFFVNSNDKAGLSGAGVDLPGGESGLGGAERAVDAHGFVVVFEKGSVTLRSLQGVYFVEFPDCCSAGHRLNSFRKICPVYFETDPESLDLASTPESICYVTRALTGSG